MAESVVRYCHKHGDFIWHIEEVYSIGLFSRYDSRFVNRMTFGKMRKRWDAEGVQYSFGSLMCGEANVCEW